MKQYPMTNWKFEGVIESRDHIHKYHAILRNDKLDVTELIPFGNPRKQHFYDATRLGNYSHLNNNNIKLRMDFILDNVNLLKKEYYSEIYFELKYLYNYVDL
mgnify:FL=1